MKQLYTYLVGALALTLSLSSCNKDDDGVMPTADLSAMNFRSVAQEGKILLQWDVPENPGYFYMKLTYTDPRTEKDHTELFSVYSNSFTVENTRARYGKTYKFTFTPYSETETAGTPYVLDECYSLAAPVTRQEVSAEKINLTVNDLWCNDPESSEGPLANLMNGNKEDYFHTNWSSAKANQHYVDIDLKEEVGCIRIHTWGRKGNAGSNPPTASLYRINAMQEAWDAGATPLVTWTDLDTSAGGENEMTYPSIENAPLDQPLRYVRFYAKAASATAWCLAEMEVYKVNVKVIDPEKDEVEVDTDVDADANTDAE